MSRTFQMYENMIRTFQMYEHNCREMSIKPQDFTIPMYSMSISEIYFFNRVICKGLNIGNSNNSLDSKPSAKEPEVVYRPRSILHTPKKGSEKRKNVTFFEVKGLIAPVFACYRNDEKLSLDLNRIDKYAQWLRSHDISAVFVHDIFGEVAALKYSERIAITEAWWTASLAYDLTVMVQVGGAPLPLVLEFAAHAEELGVHAVVCLPELFYRPQSVKKLAGYCKLVAQKCQSRPFFYYHIPEFTKVNFDMADFCVIAEETIPNFFGIIFHSNDLGMAMRCLRRGRVNIVANNTLLTAGLINDFDSVIAASLNVCPQLTLSVYKAMMEYDVQSAMKHQKELNKLIWSKTKDKKRGIVQKMKGWCNEERSIGFAVGQTRPFASVVSTKKDFGL